MANNADRAWLQNMPEPLQRPHFDEIERLRAIDRYQLRDPAWSSILADIAQLAAQLLDKPYGAVNIVGEKSVWTAAHSTGEFLEVPREVGFCPVVVESAKPLHVHNATLDSRFARYPSVLHEGLRSYTGVPLYSPEGHILGSVCAWGKKEHLPSEKQIEALHALSRQASKLLELRQQGWQLAQDHLNQRLSSQILSDIVAGSSLNEVLTMLATSVEQRVPELLCSILLVDNGFLRHGAAPSLPQELIAAVDGLAIGEDVGSCGRAAATAAASVTVDIATDPNWASLKDIALAHDLRSCWSLPIFDGSKKVIGTFALYYKTKRHPDPEHWQILEGWADLVGLAIVRSKEQAGLRWSAQTDPLTGLSNRSTLINDIRNSLMRRESGSQIAVFLCDLDGFKVLNDSLGHEHGDDFLIQLSKRLSSDLAGQAIVGRLGGDEFVMIQTQVFSQTDAESLAKKILDSVRLPTLVAGRQLVLTGSVGIALSTLNSTAEDLLRQADAAMYNAKIRGRDAYAISDERMRQQAVERFEMEVDLRAAKANKELRLLFQPNILLSSGDVAGVEALVRWNHPLRGSVGPNQFIPIAEESGVILDIGSWILETACSIHARRRETDPFYKDVRLWVNVSAVQLNSNFFATVAEALKSARLPANRLGLEITESVFMYDVHSISRDLTKLRASGVAIAIDDFGTGFSSLAQLRKLPVDIIKIDKAFIDGIGVTGADESVVVAIIRLADALGIQVVAEGVETSVQRDRLLDLGCKYAQGYLFGQPKELSEIELKFETRI